MASVFDVASPASTSPAWRCPGAAPRTRSGSRTTRGSRTSRRCGGVFERAVMEGVIATTDDVRGADQAAAAGAAGGSSSPTIAGLGPGRDAAAGEPAHQHLARLRVRLRPARPRALRHPRQPATTSRPACCRPTRRTRCCSRRRKRTGFASGCQAFGHRELLGVLRSFGLVLEPVLTVPRAEAVRLVDYLDKGASLGADAPCLTIGGAVPLATRRCRSSAFRVAAALDRRGVAAGDTVGDPVGQRPGRVRVRFRHLPRRRGLVPDQPAQRGGGEPRAARRFRLLGR